MSFGEGMIFNRKSDDGGGYEDNGDDDNDCTLNLLLSQVAIIYT